MIRVERQRKQRWDTRSWSIFRQHHTIQPYKGIHNSQASFVCPLAQLALYIEHILSVEGVFDRRRPHKSSSHSGRPCPPPPGRTPSTATRPAGCSKRPEAKACPSLSTSSTEHRHCKACLAIAECPSRRNSYIACRLCPCAPRNVVWSGSSRSMVRLQRSLYAEDDYVGLSSKYHFAESCR